MEELIKDPVLVGYFIYYVVVHEDDILMLVFDGDSITLKSTIKVSPELYEACKENYVFVSFEDPICLLICDIANVNEFGLAIMTKPNSKFIKLK